MRPSQGKGFVKDHTVFAGEKDTYQLAQVPGMKQQGPV